MSRDLYSERSPLLLSNEKKSLQSSVEDSTSQGSVQVTNKGIIGNLRAVCRGPQRIWSVLYASSVAVMISILFGYSLGYSSPALAQLSSQSFEIGLSKVNFSSEMKDIFGGLVPVGAALGGITFGPVADLVGRRSGMMIVGIPFLIGWALIALSRLVAGSAFLGLIYTGRLVTGYASGAASLVVPMYISEVAPAKLRGTLGTLPQLNVVLGIGLVYGLGAIPVTNDDYTDLSYDYLAAVAFGLVILIELLLFTVKDSPQWLLVKHYENAARNALQWFRGPQINIDPEIRDLSKRMADHHELTYMQTFKLFPKRTVWKPLILVLFIMFFQQFTGINAVIFYGSIIFKDANVTSANQVAAGAIGGIQILATIPCVLLSDLLGRKILLLIGSVGIAIFSTTLGVFFYLYDTHNCEHSSVVNASIKSDIICGSGFSALAIVSVAAFIIFFSLGWGGIPWLLSSEMFPMAVRGKCMSIATFVNWIFATIIGFTFNSYQNAVHSYGAFWTFAGFTVLSFFFVLIFLPETKGKKLHEIEAHFAGKHVEDMVFEKNGVNVVIE